MSAKDKSGLGYGDQIHEGVLSYENEVLESVIDSRSSDVEDSPMYDRFVKVEGMHAVPPLMTGIYMPSNSNFGIDESNFTYGPKQSKTSESATNTSDSVSCESNSSVETLESMPKPAVNEPKAVSKPKVWSDAPIIKEYESNSDYEYVIKPSKEQEKPSFAFVNTNGLMSKKLGLGYGFTKKACFVCGSFSHLIRDCDFHEKRIAKQVELNKQKGKVNTARQNFNSQAVSTSAARKVNTAKPIVNEIRPRNNFYKSHSPIRRPFNRTTTPKANFSNQKVNTAGVKAVSAAGGIRETAVKPLVDNPQRALKKKEIVDSGCSRHMTRNKAYLAEYQDYNGGHVSFGGSKGYITGKDTECLVLSSDLKLPDENQVLLRIPRQNNMYSFNLKNIIPSRGIACLIAKATVDESNKWHRRLGHVNFENINKLVKGNL
ncbi:ribonuclease H-like domain-containing protein, partial [Tanacetum coccineum]